MRKSRALDMMSLRIRAFIESCNCRSALQETQLVQECFGSVQQVLWKKVKLNNLDLEKMEEAVTVAALDLPYNAKSDTRCCCI